VNAAKDKTLGQAIAESDVDEIAFFLKDYEHNVRMNMLHALFERTAKINAAAQDEEEKEDPEVHHADTYLKGFQAKQRSVEVVVKVDDEKYAALQQDNVELLEAFENYSRRAVRLGGHAH